MVTWLNSVFQPNEFLTLGGTIEISLISLPEPVESLKGWLIRPVKNVSSTVETLPYPLPGAAVAIVTTPPFTVKYEIPRHIIINDTPTIRWWDGSVSQWSEEGVAEVTFDSETRTISFQTSKIGTFSALQLVSKGYQHIKVKLLRRLYLAALGFPIF